MYRNQVTIVIENQNKRKEKERKGGGGQGEGRERAGKGRDERRCTGKIKTKKALTQSLCVHFKDYPRTLEKIFQI